MAASPTPRPAGAERPGVRTGADAAPRPAPFSGQEAGTPPPSAHFPALARASDATREAIHSLPDAAACAHPLAVAFSGGADSTALLRLACLLAPGRVQAFHIHHGLQEAADDFERHCVSLCEAWGVPLRVLRVQARHAPGESPEDAARRARYAALAEAARGAEGAGQSPTPVPVAAVRVWLGQHADDQVETMLLALSRGAGLPGLAAMPARFEREGVTFERPLLAVPGAELRAWLQSQGIAWVEDPTNQDTAFTRNRIRHQLLPALEAAFPQFRETFARSARHAAQAQGVLARLAEDDLAAARAATDEAEEGEGPGKGRSLSLPALQALPRERQGNLLRHWLRVVHGAAASAAQLEELLDQVADCRTRGHRIRLRVGAGRVERVGAALAFLAHGDRD